MFVLCYRLFLLSPRRLCFHLCLFVCLLTRLHKKTTEQNFMKVYEMVEHNTWTNKLDFE